MKIKEGDKIWVWWNSEKPETIIGIFPYNGRYDTFFDCVLRITSSTRRGYMEMAFNSSDSFNLVKGVHS